MRVRGFEMGDLDAVVAIQSQSPEIARWSRKDYERVVHGNFAGWIAQAESGVIGFLIARNVANEMEILNLAVARGARRRGAGSALLHEAVSLARLGGVRRAFLEVRETNLSAIHFYARHGFAATGRRLRYYSDPVEDALVLSSSLE